MIDLENYIYVNQKIFTEVIGDKNTIISVEFLDDNEINSITKYSLYSTGEIIAIEVAYKKIIGDMQVKNYYIKKFF